MTDPDIVARLRVLNHHAKKLAENESLHDLYREAFIRCENLTWEAADEIERLRAECDRLARRNTILVTDIETLSSAINKATAATAVRTLLYRGEG